MRKIALTLAAAAGIVGAVSSSSNRAEAAILNASAAITGLARPVNYVCRWSYWGRRCWWRPGYHDDDYGYHRPYYGYYGYHRYGYHRRHCWIEHCGRGWY